MKISRSRKHHVNLGNFESVEFSASVELEIDETQTIHKDKMDATIVYLNHQLDALLAADMNEALANVPEGDKTHVETWGVEK